MPLVTQFQERVYAEEMMDLPSTERSDFKQALTDIRWVNRNLGGTKTLIQAIEALIQGSPQKQFTVLDLGTGAADIPLALAEWGKKIGIDFHITAVDIHPVAVEVSQEITSSCPQIEVIQGDALNLTYPDQQFDLVTSSLFMHHLDSEGTVRLLQEMARLSRIGFVVNDLERHPVAYYAILLIAKLTCRQKISQHDAPLSVLRAYSIDEVKALRTKTHLQNLQVSRRFPYRLVVTWKRENG